MVFNASASPDNVAGTYMVLTAAGGVPPYQWAAYPNGGDAYTVVTAATDPTGATGIDPYAPLGREINYRCTDRTGATVDTGSVQLPDPPGGASALLSSANDPNQWMAVTVLDQTPTTWQGRSVWFDVLDRRDPFVAVAPTRLRAGTLVIRSEDNDTRRGLVAAIAPGYPLILRTTCGDAVDDVTFLVLDVSEDLALDTAKAGARHWTIAYQAVTREIGVYLPDPEWTWQDTVADPRNPSWTAVVAGYTSWAELVSNRRAP